MRIAIVGGTFDPFHRGHLEPVLSVRDQMRWDRILYMPAHRQPFKLEHAHASGHHRFAMAALATYEREGVYVSDLELARGEVSYSVDTLEQLRESDSSSTFDWVIGDDNVAALLEWKSIGRILELANFVVLQRKSVTTVPDVLQDRLVEPSAARANGAIVFVPNAAVPISSTEVRRRVNAGEPVVDMVGSEVSRYIRHYGLYREGQW